MGLFSDIISSIGNGISDVFGGGGGNNDQKKRQQQQQAPPTPAPLNRGPVQLPAVFQAAQQQQQNNPLQLFHPAQQPNPQQPQQQQPQAAPQVQTQNYQAPVQHESLWGHLLHGGEGLVKNVASPFVNVGEDVSNGIGNAEVGAAHALGLAKDVKTQTNQQQFGGINNAVGLPTQDNNVKNFLLNTGQVAATVLAPEADAAGVAGVRAVAPDLAPSVVRIAGHVGTGAALGGGFNAANGIENGENPGQVAKDFGTGALIGGAGGGLFSAVPAIRGALRSGADRTADETAGAAGKTVTVESGTKAAGEAVNAPAGEAVPPTKAEGAVETGVKPPAAAPAEPTVADLSTNATRPAGDIQKAIEDAHNAGDQAKAAQLIETLPQDLQAPMRSALGIPEPAAAAAKPVAGNPGIGKTGNAAQDVQNATSLVKNLLEGGRDYSGEEPNLQNVLDLANSHLHSNDVVAKALNDRLGTHLSDTEARNVRNAIETGSTAGLSAKEAAVAKALQENIENPSSATRIALSPDYQAANNHFPQVRQTTVKDATQAASKVKGLGSKLSTFSDLLNRNSRFSEGSSLGTFTDKSGKAITGDANDLGLAPKKNGTFVDKNGKVYNYSRATSQDLENAGAKLQAPKDALTAYVRDTLNLKTRADASDYLIKNADNLGLHETEAPGSAQPVTIKGSDGTDHNFFTDSKTAKNIKDSGIIGNFRKEANLPLKAWNALSSMIAQATVVNPFAHGLNLATNAAVGAGERANGITGVSTLLRSLKPIDEASELRMSDAGVHFPTYGKNTATLISKATGGLSKLNETAVAAIDKQVRAGMFENLTKGGMTDREAAQTINKWMGGRNVYRGDQANLGIFWNYFGRQVKNAGQLFTQAAKGHGGPLINAAIASGVTYAADQGLKNATGNQGAYIHAPGVVGILNDAMNSGKDVATGQFRNAVNPVVNHINPLVSTTAEQLLGVNNYGDKFKNGQDRLNNALGVTPETNLLADNGHSAAEKGLNTFGIYTPHIKGAPAAAPGSVPGDILNVKGAQSGATVAFPKDFTGEQNAKAVDNYLGATGTQYSSKTAATIASQTQDQQKAYTAATQALKKVGITSASDIHNFAQLSPSDQADYVKAATQLNQGGTAISSAALESQLVKNGNVELAASLNKSIPTSLSPDDKKALETYSTLGSDGQKGVWLQDNNNATNYYQAVINQKNAQGALTTDDTDVGSAWSGSGNSLYVKYLVAQTDKQNNVPQSLVELYKNTTKTEYNKMSGAQKDQLTAYAQQLNNNGVIDKFGLGTGTSGSGSGGSSTSPSAADRAAGLPYGTISESFVKPTSDAGLKSVNARSFTAPKLAQYTPDVKANPFVRSITATKGVK